MKIITIFNEKWSLEAQDEKKIYIRRENEEKIHPVSKFVLTPEELSQL